MTDPVHPNYRNFKFPDYVFQEYPKWVTPDDGSPAYLDYGPGDEENEPDTKVIALADPLLNEVEAKRRGRPPKAKG